jgi:hypothetical protein
VRHHERPRDIWWLLGAIYRRTSGEMRGEYGGPTRTALARIVVVTVVLGFAGSTLWAAFKALLPTILVIAAIVVGLRLLRRLVQHLRQG